MLRLIGNIIWLVFTGFATALGWLLASLLMFLTIIGIPLAAGHLKLIPVSLWPFGREIVSVEEARTLEATSAIAVR